MPGSGAHHVLRLGVLFAFVGALFAALALFGDRFADLARTAPLGLAIVFLALASITFGYAVRILLLERQDRRRESRHAWRERVGELLRETSDYGVLPRLSELPDTAFGISPTRYSETGEAPYVPRDRADQLLRNALTVPDRPYPFVLVVGETKSGKTRTALEAVRTAFGGRNPAVILPKHGPSLVDFARLRTRLNVDPAPAIVWLDDVDGPMLDHLSADVVEDLSNWAIVVGTMPSTRYQRIRRGGADIAAATVSALHRARRIVLDTEPTEYESAAFRRAYPRVWLDGGIGASLAGGTEIAAKYRGGSKVSPAGLAVVRAAVDWQRAGMGRPITETELRCLFPLYLRELDVDIPPTYDQFASGVEWAVASLESGPALLIGEGDGWQASNYVAALDDRSDGEFTRPIPDQTWRELLAIASPPEAFGLAVSAYLRGSYGAAATVFRWVVDAGESGHRLAANVGLGMALSKLDEVGEAAVAFRTVLESGHPGQMPRAALNLGLLLSKKGDTVGARAAFDQAAASGHTDYAPRAAFSLGLLLAKHNDSAGAQAAFERAVRSNHPDASPSAAVGLGGMLHAHGDLVGARAAYQKAIQSGHPDAAPLAQELLSELPAPQPPLGLPAQPPYEIPAGDPAAGSVRAPGTWQ